MDKVTLKAVKREKTGKCALAQLRNQGMIPGVVYGHGDQPVMVSVSAAEFNKKFNHISENIMISLELNNDEPTVLIKDYQFDPATRKITHLDFIQVHKGVEITTKVPVKLSGRSKGEADGGVMEQLLNELRITCFPRHLPSEITIDVSAMEIDSSFHVSEITGYDEIKFLNAPDEVIAQVYGKSAMSSVEDTPAEAAAEGTSAENA
ncbi:MAG: 50S ribosomal protein L25 [Spirochaetia bacterium]|nr:50S ribosomal protein L25 [Spirochaetia bacterium]